jgi:hypothetical protein
VPVIQIQNIGPKVHNLCERRLGFGSAFR